MLKILLKWIIGKTHIFRNLKNLELKIAFQALIEKEKYWREKATFSGTHITFISRLVGQELTFTMVLLIIIITTP